MAVTKKYEIVENDLWSFAIVWKDPAGAPRDLTGWTATCMVRATYDTSGAPLLTLNGVISAPLTGRADFSGFAALPQGKYVYDVEFKIGTTDKQTLLRGVLEVLPEVTT